MGNKILCLNFARSYSGNATPTATPTQSAQYDDQHMRLTKCADHFNPDVCPSEGCAMVRRLRMPDTQCASRAKTPKPVRCL